MIVLFHTFYIVTRFILNVLSKSIFNKAQNTSQEHETNLNFIVGDSNFTSESEFESEAGIRFFPPVYVQRYIAVKNILQDERWHGKIRKVVDFGCAEFGLFPYMKHIRGLQEVVTVDIDREMLDHYCCRAAPLNADYLDCRQQRLTVHVLAGSIADRDPRLLGTDAVICIELIEHVYPDTLEAIPYTVFGFIQPLIAIFTTPNADFNVLFPNFTGFRHSDHKFEWSRAQFEDWATNITTRYPAYAVKIHGIGQGPKGTEVHGCCSQMAVFIKLSHYNPAPVIQQTSQHEDLEVEECEETYVAVREYDYPFRVDNRTDEEKILHQAEYYIRLLANNEKYCNDMSIQIPLQHILPLVEMCSSTSMLRKILEEAGWEMVEHTEGDEAVLYPYQEEYESSVHESEDFYCEGQEEDMANLQVADDMAEDWDAPQPPYGSFVTSNLESQLVKDTDSVELDGWSLGVVQPQWDVQLQRNGDLESHDVISSSCDSCKSRTDDTCVSSDVGCFKSYESVELIPLGGYSSIRVNANKMMNSTSEHSDGISTNLDSEHDVDIQSLAGLKPEILSLNVEDTLTPCIYSNANKEDFKFSDIGQNCTPGNEQNVESLKKLDFEKFSNSEALMDHKSETHKKLGEILSLCSYPEDSKVIGKHSEVLHQNSQCLAHQVNSRPLKSLNVNSSSDCTVLNPSTRRNTIEKLSNVCQNVHTEGSSPVELLYLNLMREVAESSASQAAVMSQSLNFGSASSSILESSQDRSLVESSSLDEQNDKAVDSGYPNSFSVQDMDMDLTPEQVDELSTESDEILTGNSEDSEYESDSSEESDRIDDNDGFLFRFHHEALYDPMALVENGDVANNNRDGEGNNAVAIIHLPPEPGEIVDPAADDDDDLLPLLAAAEDFDNDNDLILPADVQPFPHWLLHLLGLVNHGGGDLQNYVMPAIGDGGFLLPDGLGDDEDDDDDDSGAPSSSSSEIGDSEVGSEGDLEFGEEPLVPGDIGGGGEPDTFQGGI